MSTTFWKQECYRSNKLYKYIFAVNVEKLNLTTLGGEGEVYDIIKQRNVPK